MVEDGLRASLNTLESDERSSTGNNNNPRGSVVASKRMTILGTVAFMAPELVNNARTYTESIDIYALGVTFWEIWTNKDPYADLTTFQIYDKVKKVPYLHEQRALCVTCDRQKYDSSIVCLFLCVFGIVRIWCCSHTHTICLYRR